MAAIPTPIFRNEAQDAIVRIVRFALFVSLGLAVVTPHSFQLVEALAFVMTSALAGIIVRDDPWLRRVMLTYFLGVIVTAIYIWIGYVNGAPRAATNQTLFVYIISPLMWILMSTALMQYVGIVRVIRWLIWFTWAAVISVALFFYLFLTFGPASVMFLTDDPNVNVQGGFAASTMLVYGSLMFLSGGLFAQPDLVRNKYARIALPGLVLLAALTSGRSALILAIPIGVAVGLVLRARQRAPGADGRRSSVLVPTLLLGLAGAVLLVAIDFFVGSIDLVLIFDTFWNELASGGGSERVDQTSALWEGFLNSYGLGVGHGKGVQYIRSTEFPWRYEVMPAATLLRVGLVGAIIYASTFLVYGRALLSRFAARDLSPQDIYMIGGFVPAALAIATNPYIESFVFQWMYFLPVMSLAVRPAAAGAR